MRVLLLVATGCVVVQPYKLRDRSRWHAGEAVWESGCVAARAFVRKSGKEGFGLAIQLKSRTDCRVQLAHGRLTFEGGGVVELAETTTLDLRGRSLIYTWLPVRFDGNAAWNDGKFSARLELTYNVDGVAAPPWQFALEQRQGNSVDP